MEILDKMQVLLLYSVDPAWEEDEQREVDRESRRLGFAMRRQGYSVSFQPVCEPSLDTILSAYDPRNHLVFNWCEDVPGVNRGEPVVAKTLENMDFAYTGASSETLKLSYDKAKVKEMLATRGVPVPLWKVVKSVNEGGWTHFPAIVKPACEHCSLGVDEGAVVMNPSELGDRVAHVLKEFRQPALIEDFIDGREFHVSLWGNDEIEMLPPVEMDFSSLDDVHDRLCSYDAKFDLDSRLCREIETFAPARLTGEEMRQLESTSIAAYETLGCRDYGRIDLRMRDGVFYVLDVNPNADISADASLALAAEKAGYCYGAMGSRVIEFAAERLNLRT